MFKNISVRTFILVFIFDGFCYCRCDLFNTIKKYILAINN